MSKKDLKSNLLAELARRKALNGGSRFGVLGKDLASHLASGEKPQPIIRRGGRNGSGKPS